MGHYASEMGISFGRSYGGKLDEFDSDESKALYKALYRAFEYGATAAHAVEVTHALEALIEAKISELAGVRS